MSETRACRACGDPKQLTDFPRTRPEGPRRTICKACTYARKHGVRGVRRCTACPGRLLKPFSEFGTITVTRRMLVEGEGSVPAKARRTIQQRDVVCRVCRAGIDATRAAQAARRAAIVAERLAAQARKDAQRVRPRTSPTRTPSAAGRRIPPPDGRPLIPPRQPAGKVDFTELAHALAFPNSPRLAVLPLAQRQQVWALAKVLARHFTPRLYHQKFVDQDVVTPEGKARHAWATGVLEAYLERTKQKSA